MKGQFCALCDEWIEYDKLGDHICDEHTDEDFDKAIAEILAYNPTEL